MLQLFCGSKILALIVFLAFLEESSFKVIDPIISVLSIYSGFTFSSYVTELKVFSICGASTWVSTSKVYLPFE